MKIRFVALSEEELKRGLMGSEPLAVDEVALFIYQECQPMAFWNKNVSFPIGLLFFDDYGNYVGEASLDANQETNVPDHLVVARFVLETHIDFLSYLYRGFEPSLSECLQGPE